MKSLPDINLEKERVKKAIAKHGPPRGCLVEYAAQHGLNVVILRNLTTPPTALTIKQPWAWAIAVGHKDVENRTWPTHYRGPLLIHAAKKPDPMGFEFLAAMGIQPPDTLEYGGIIAASDLVDCVQGYPSDWAMPDHYQFVLQGVRSLPFKPMRGQLGLWRVQ